MPTYDYFCSSCDEKIETFQKITEPALTKCPKCSKETLVRKPGGGIGLSFIGDGFYSTMHGDKKNSKESTATNDNSSGCCPCGKNKSTCDVV